MSFKGTRMSNLYDVVVIGGGPAGLTAGLYLARARYRVIIVEKERFGGQVAITSDVVNYPGVARASGAALAETMRKQADAFGAEFLFAEVASLDMSGDIKTVRTSRGELKCFGVLLATGARPRAVGFHGEDEFRGRGVAYCAACDGEFFADKDVFVVGGGFAAAEEAVFLTRYARHVTILVREPDFACAQGVAETAKCHEKIAVLYNTEVVEVAGDTALRYLRYRNTVTGEITEYRAGEGNTFGLFVFAGYAPATELVRSIAECTDEGYVVTDKSQKTSCEGLYAAGDVCVKPLRQVVTAVGDGALAATELERYASAMQKKTGLRPRQPAASQAAAKPESAADAASETTLFSADEKRQLNAVFERMERPLILKLYLDGSPLSRELAAYMVELCRLTDMLSLEEAEGDGVDHIPCVRVCRADGSWTGLAFHGVPGGYEFTSFVLGLYNAAGRGQSLDEESLEAIASLNPVSLKVIVTLSCAMCPDLVTAAQKIAALNEGVTAEVYDFNRFGDLHEKYNVMSVPCLVVNDGEKISFGKKNIAQIINLIKRED